MPHVASHQTHHNSLMDKVDVLPWKKRVEQAKEFFSTWQGKVAAIAVVGAVGLAVGIGIANGNKPEAANSVSSGANNTASTQTTPTPRSGGFASSYERPLICTGRTASPTGTGSYLLKPEITPEIDNLNTHKLYTVAYSQKMDADHDIINSNYQVVEGVDTAVEITAEPRTDTNLIIVDLTGTDVKSLDAQSIAPLLTAGNGKTLPDSHLMDCHSDDYNPNHYDGF